MSDVIPFDLDGSGREHSPIWVVRECLSEDEFVIECNRKGIVIALSELEAGTIHIDLYTSPASSICERDPIKQMLISVNPDAQVRYSWQEHPTEPRGYLAHRDVQIELNLTGEGLIVDVWDLSGDESSWLETMAFEYADIA